MQDRFIKIINTTYRILDFFPENDPLKNKAKEKALEILEGLTLINHLQSLSSLQGLISKEDQEKYFKLLDNIELLKNYLTVGKDLGWLDSLNFVIIFQEYKLIEDLIKKQCLVFSNLNKVVKDFSAPVNKLIAKNKKSKGLNFKFNKASGTQNQQPVITGKKSLIVGQNLPSEKMTTRQDKILEILGKNQKAQVSDFIKELPNITKRTVRRDVDDLLKKGRIIRTGQWNQVFYQINKFTG